MLKTITKLVVIAVGLLTIGYITWRIVIHLTADEGFWFSYYCSEWPVTLANPSNVRHKNMNYEEIELHDANLKSTSVNYEANSVAFEIDYYPTEQSKQRISATFKFSEVSDYNENSNFKELFNHSKVGGNISYWVPALKAGTTYFYLARGFISITAKSVAVVNHV